MSPFDQAFSIGSGPRFALYGEPVTLTPMVKTSNGRASPDPNRAVVTVIGIWNETPTDIFPDSQQVPGKSSHQLSAGMVVLSVLKSSLPWEPRQEDVATRVATSQRMKVADQSFDGSTDWDLTLTAQQG